MSGDKRQESDSSYFSLPQSNSNSSFSARCTDAFASLEALEKRHEAYEQSRAHSKHEDERLVMKADPIPTDDSDCISSKRSDEEVHHGRYGGGERSQPDHDRPRHWRGYDHRFRDKRDTDGFRRPHRRPPRHAFQCVPGYKKNPGKWTCYSLEDVKKSDMSEKSNQRAAFEFLAERRKARESECQTDKIEVNDTVCSKGVISFSKPKLPLGDNFSQQKDTTGASGKIASREKQSTTSERTLRFEEETDMQVVKETTGDPSSSCDSDSSSKKLTDDATSGFKARKTVRRCIRQKESED